MRPHRLVLGEVRSLIALSVSIVEEVRGHARKWLGAHQFTTFPHNASSCSETMRSFDYLIVWLFLAKCQAKRPSLNYDVICASMNLLINTKYRVYDVPLTACGKQYKYFVHM